ncbi:MAG: copper amine oxidase N-terminal domain-containing protein [Lachnospirales bacterium]
MKKTTKVIISTAICTTLLTTTIFAKTGEVMLKAYYSNIKVELNGEELVLKDQEGTVVEPFIVDGTTYLPVRNVADALGLDVGWDGKTNTVKLGSGALADGLSLTKTDVWTKDYHDSYSFREITDTFTSILDTKYTDGFIFSTGPIDTEEAVFRPAGHYDTFEFTIVMGKDNKGKSVQEITEDGAIEIWGDDKLLHTIDNLYSDETEPLHVMLDIEDVVNLKIKYYSDTTEKRTWAMINPVYK